MLFHLDKIVDCFAGRERIFDFATGALSDIATRIDDKDFVGKVDFAQVHIVEHFFHSIGKYLVIARMAKKADRDNDVTFERKSFLLAQVFVFELCAPAQSDYFVISYHLPLLRMTKEAITPGTQPHAVRSNVIRIEPQPLSKTANGGKIIARITRMSDIVILVQSF